MATSNQSDFQSGSSDAPTLAPGVVLTSMAEIAQRGQKLCGSYLETLAQEQEVLFDEMARESAEALEQLRVCKSPLDVLAFEQNWLLTCAKVCMDSSLRLFEAAIRRGETGIAAPSGFRLPE